MSRVLPFIKRLCLIVLMSRELLLASAFAPAHFHRQNRATGTSLRMEEIECDVVIVGGGPAGCTCALYTARANHDTVILDKNPSAGALAITSTIANYPGVDPTMGGEELLDAMRKQAIDYGTTYKKAQVFMFDFDGESDRKIVYTPDATYKARALVLATGSMGRKPTIRGEAEYLGKGVSYCATCDAAFYQGSEVAVVGTNSEAVDEAHYLTGFCSKVHWICPEGIPKNPIGLENLPNVVCYDKANVVQVEGTAVGVEGITIKTRGDDTQLTIPAEGVFIYVAGSKPITDYVSSKVEFEKNGGVKVNDEMTTSIDGVFAIGDIKNTPFKQVVVAAGEGCVAAMSIDRYLKGRKSVKVDWIHK